MLKSKLRAVLLLFALVLGSTAGAVATASPASAWWPSSYCPGAYLAVYNYQPIHAEVRCSGWPPSSGYPTLYVAVTCIERLDYNYGWVNDDGPGWCNALGLRHDTMVRNCTYGGSTVFRSTVYVNDANGNLSGPALTAYSYGC